MKSAPGAIPTKRVHKAAQKATTIAQQADHEISMSAMCVGASTPASMQRRTAKSDMHKKNTKARIRQQ